MVFGERVSLVVVFAAVLVYLFSFAAPSSAVVIASTITPTNNTFFPTPNGTCGLDNSQSYYNGNATGAHNAIYWACNGTGFYDYYLYNISVASNKIILSMNFSAQPFHNLVFGQQTCYVPFFSSNTSWVTQPVVDSILTADRIQVPALYVPTGTTTAVCQGILGLSVFNWAPDLGTPAILANLYNLPGDSVSLELDPSSNSAGVYGFYDSKNLTLGIQVADFQTLETDVTFGAGTKFYYDFDSHVGSFSPFPQADFVYTGNFDLFNPNTIQPINGVTMALPFSEGDKTNTLSTTNCFSGQTYGTGTALNINYPVSNGYNLMCFNLSSQHAGRNYLAAIKVLNTTGNLFSFFAAQYSPVYSTLSTPQVSPNPMLAGQNATVTWTSSSPTTTILHYFFTLFGVVSPVATITDSNFTISHSVTIPGDQIFHDAIFSVSPSGIDQSNNFFNSPYFNFTVSSAHAPLPQLPFVNGTCQIWVLTYTNQGFPTAAYVSIDGQPATHTEQFSSNTTTVGYVDATGFTSIGGESSCFGLHNISAFYPGSESVNRTVDVESTPFFVNIKFGVANTCIKLSETNDNVTTTSNLLNSINLNANIYNTTGYYVAYNASTDTWQGFACLDGYFPASLAQFFNSTVPIGSSSSNVPGISNVVPAFANPIAAALGITPDQVLNMLSLIISIIVMGVVGFYTRNGLVSALVFLGMIILFSLIGWLPIWIMVILVVIAALLISRYGRNMFMTGGE